MELEETWMHAGQRRRSKCLLMGFCVAKESRWTLVTEPAPLQDRVFTSACIGNCVEGPNSEPSRIPGDNLGIVGLGRNRLALSDDLVVSETIGRLPWRKLPRFFRIRQEQASVSDNSNAIGIVQALLREPTPDGLAAHDGSVRHLEL